MLHNFVSPYNATVVERFIDAGTVLLGKTNMDEFAMGSSNETSFFGDVKTACDAHSCKRFCAFSFFLSGRSRSLRHGDGHRHRWVYPPARSILRRNRIQANLWACFSLGNDRFCIEPRPGRSDN